MSFSSTKNNAHNSNNNDNNMANSSSDFVSADVNEVLQDARQILTNREQRHDGQHPNELDESTTVQVTKQGGDEDPMELTVMRKRLVKGEEAGTEDPGNEEDDVQLKVEITEHCRQQEGKGTQFVEQMIAVMGLATIVVSFWDKFNVKLYRPVRAGIFSCMGLNVTVTSTTTTVNLPRYRKLPAELDREIFLFLKPAAQRKFIWGLNWDFYAMFRYRLLTKSKRVRNPTGNRWDGTTTRATVAADGLHVSTEVGFPHVLTEQPFPVSGPLSRMDDFPGTILYYYEVKGKDLWASVGFSDGTIPYGDDGDVNQWQGQLFNSYAIQTYLLNYECWLAGQTHPFELPEGSVRPIWNRYSVNVFGSGLVLDPEDKLTIFFTVNGKLLGRKIPIIPAVDRLFPAVLLWGQGSVTSFEANFGDDPAKPFAYNIKNCPGLELDCV